MGDGTLVNLALIGEGGACDELAVRYEDTVLEEAEQTVGNSFSARKKIFLFFSPYRNLGGVFSVYYK